MTLGENQNLGEPSGLTDLPDDILFVVLSYCEVQTLGRLGQVCSRFNRLVNQECVWVWLRRRLTVVGDSRGHSHNRKNISVKEQCRVAMNWKAGHFHDVRLVRHRDKQMPWLQMGEDHMWVSYKNLIKCYEIRPNSCLQEVSVRTLRGHHDDICRFVAKDNLVVSGSRTSHLMGGPGGRASLYAFNSQTGERVWGVNAASTTDIQAVDFHGTTVISGARNATVKVWSMHEGAEADEETPLSVINVQDRVWSLAVNPEGSTFCTGTAGINHVPPLRLWDTERGLLLSALGGHYRNGAGILDIQYESPFTLLSCGYDTCIRLWDLRTSFTKCVLHLEEPFDSTVYCIKSDGDSSIMSGTARHGMTRLWDKRRADHNVQLYFGGGFNSPVYSLAFDSTHLYIGLDKGINMLDFTASGPPLPQPPYLGRGFGTRHPTRN